MNDVKLEGEEPNCQNDAQDHLFKRSTVFYRLQTLALLTLLVLTGKKLAFKFSTYIFEYQSLPTYINCTSTHVMNSHRPSLFFAGILILCIIVTEGKNGGGLGTRLLLHVVAINMWYSIPVATTLTCTLISTT